LQGLLEEALELPPLARTAWLESLPSIHEPLREPLRRLLEVHEGLDSRPFIDGFGHGTEGLTPPASVLIGDLVGPYRLLQQIGDGGMGSVWLAERADGSIKRKVALKLPRMVWARDLASRMARERDILGSLEHSRIARLYDAGVDQLGRPFLALEYVEGERIDHHCDEQRHGMAQRIRLFLQVLEAVQHAHINLVLHRDLKPANVLVDQRGEVRLLDFGIAKLLDDDSSPTPADAHSRSLSRAMTPRYASPEQVQQLRLSLASDVYSLGVMLYELLVGATPYVTANGSRAELEIAIVEGHLRLPSRAALDATTANRRQSTPARLARSLRGELDAVLLKALARNPIERYPSAEALRADLTRWLDGHPVRAKRPSSLLALRKFVVRNAWSVAFGSAAACAVIVAALIALMQAREARLESQRAAATRDFLLGLFENANPELHGGRDVTARELLLKGESLLDQSVHVDAETKADVYSGIANLWSRLGDTHRTVGVTTKRKDLIRDLGPSKQLLAAVFDEAEAALQAGELSVLQSALAEITSLSAKVDLSETQKSEFHCYSGWMSLKLGMIDDAIEQFSTAHDIAARITNQEVIVRALSGRVHAHVLKGKRQLALSDYELAIRALQEAGFPEGEKLRRAFELIAPLYALGEYNLGWPLIGSLAKQSSKIFGEFSSSQALLHTYWINWSLKVHQTRDTISWIKRRKEALSSGQEEQSKLSDFDFSILEARLLIATGSVDQAMKILDQISVMEDGLSPKKRHAISLVKIESMLLAADAGALQAELSSPLWQIDDRSNKRYKWLTDRGWYQGLADILAGRYRHAEGSLTAAESAAGREFGMNHPRTMLISFDKKMSALLQQPEDTEAVMKHVNEAEKVVQSLSVSLGDGHPTVEKARSIANFLRKDPSALKKIDTARERGRLILY
jgi:serine/threonine protein kinase